MVSLERAPFHHFPHTKPPLQALVCNISTGAVGEENGAIELWPRSHLEQRSADLAESQLEGNDVPMLTGRLTDQQLHAGDIHPAIAEERRLSRPPLRCCTPKGSLLLRDMKLWHRGTVSAAPSPRPSHVTHCRRQPNPSEQPRFMLAVIIGKRTPPAPGEHDGGDQYIRPDYMTFGRGCESVIARSPFGARERWSRPRTPFHPPSRHNKNAAHRPACQVPRQRRAGSRSDAMRRGQELPLRRLGADAAPLSRRRAPAFPMRHTYSCPCKLAQGNARRRRRPRCGREPKPVAKTKG